jgi:hypothetical protein
MIVKQKNKILYDHDQMTNVQKNIFEIKSDDFEIHKFAFDMIHYYSNFFIRIKHPIWLFYTQR